MYVRTESEKEDISMKCVCVSCFLRTYFIDQKKKNPKNSYGF